MSETHSTVRVREAYDAMASIVSDVSDVPMLLDREGQSLSTSDLAGIVTELDAIERDAKRLVPQIEAAKQHARSLYDERLPDERKPKAA